MSDYGNIGDGLGRALKAAMWLLAISILLAVWKSVEITVWLWKHINIEILK